MPTATTDDGVGLYYEVTGTGRPLVFVHEFAGDHRSWEHQVRHFGRRYRCITYAARGYPPSQVPEEASAYGQARAVADLVCVLDAAQVERAHVVGNSMGGFCALHFAVTHPERAFGVAVCGCGYGSHPDKQASFQQESERIASAFEEQGAAETSKWYGLGPSRLQYRAKDPRGHAEHVRELSEHDWRGSALTMRSVQMRRPSLHAMTDELAEVDVPVLLVAGDEDDGALDTTLMLKRTMPRAGLCVIPRTGHLTNLEEPALFNQALEAFFAQVENDRWDRRDPGSISQSATGA